jgi:3',5'-cyclic AMP phosphodiesterase CpdA
MDSSHVTRRAFLRTSAAAFGAAAAAPLLKAGGAESAGEFSFVVANDLHYRDQRCAPWFEKVIASIRDLRPRPAFVVLAGDLSENGARDQLGAVRDSFKTLPMPIKTVIGNHDHNADDGRKPFGEIFGATPNARFEVGGWQFLTLDTTEGNAVFRTRISAETLQWVQKTAPTLDRSKPVIVLTHFPLGRNWLRPVNASALLDALRRCNFQGSFGGHWHGWTEPVENGSLLITGRCASWWRTNHDGSDEKGYFLCRATSDGVTHRFVPVPA